MTDRVHVIDSNCVSFQLQQYKNSGMTPHTNKDSSSHDEKVMSSTDLRIFSRSTRFKSFLSINASSFHKPCQTALVQLYL